MACNPPARSSISAGRWSLRPRIRLFSSAAATPITDARDYDRAIADYDDAVMLDAGNAGAFCQFRCNGAFALTGDYGRAIADYNSALKLRPDLPGVAL